MISKEREAIKDFDTLDEYLSSEHPNRTTSSDSPEEIKKALKGIAEILDPNSPIPKDKTEVYQYLNLLNFVGSMVETEIIDTYLAYPDETRALFRQSESIALCHHLSPSVEKSIKGLIERIELGKDIPNLETGKGVSNNFDHNLTEVLVSFQTIITYQFSVPKKNQRFSSYIVDLGGAERRVIDDIQDLIEDKPTEESKSSWASVMRDFLLLYEKVPTEQRNRYIAQKSWYETLMKKSKARQKLERKKSADEANARYIRERRRIEDEIGFESFVKSGHFPKVANLDELTKHKDFQNHEEDLAGEMLLLRQHKEQLKEELKGVDAIAKSGLLITKSKNG